MGSITSRPPETPTQGDFRIRYQCGVLWVETKGRYTTFEAAKRAADSMAGKTKIVEA